MNDDELKKIEQESTELFALLREVRDEDNVTVRIPPSLPRLNKKSLRINPYWLVAASVLGFVLGIAIPRENRCTSQECTTQFADTGHTTGRSLADGDVNFVLLIK
ncbi:MAG: hypothetical protein IKW46_07925 [Bacteroidaceae bacterium]|nr:hypothetical protein [Bacteroidaceae bacterium]